VTTGEIEVNLRNKNQLTLPEAVVRRLGIQPGDRLIVEIDDEHPDEVKLRPLRRSYAGVLAGLFGSADEVRAYIRDERASWKS
jgi:antitoxin ChpS